MKKIVSLIVSLVMLGSSVLVRAESGAPASGDKPPLNDQVSACVIAAVGQARWTIIAADHAQATEAERGQIKTCFSDQPNGNNNNGEHRGVTMSAELQACLAAAIGQDRFTAISGGQSKPTDAEEQAGHACFSKFGEKPPAVNTAGKIPDSVEECMKLAVGEDHFNGIKDGTAAPTVADRDAGQKCFGAPAGSIAPDVKPPIGIKLKACLLAIAGEARFNAISSGQSEPTAAEKTAGAGCFSKGQDENASESILPPPTQEVPFLPEGKKTVDITSSSVSSTHGKPTLTVQGTGKPGEAIDVHLFSKGTTVTVQVGKNGKWSYKFNRSLSSGKHKVYATARAGKKTVRSAGKSVTIASTK